MKLNKLIPLVFLGVLTLTGCGNSTGSNIEGDNLGVSAVTGCGNLTDLSIEEDKSDSVVDSMTDEERFDYAIDRLKFQGSITGYSREDEVIALKVNLLNRELDEHNEGLVAYTSLVLADCKLDDVTVYIEYFMNDERIAVSEVTTRDSDLILD